MCRARSIREQIACRSLYNPRSEIQGLGKDLDPIQEAIHWAPQIRGSLGFRCAKRNASVARALRIKLGCRDASEVMFLDWDLETGSAAEPRVP
ncbi:hypothetical protein PGTUg99_029265 [Puccinia graminis f. sp. tritici]|uniref:Uncharacterized protein n=1 Tax=Puccinia graminis f. sp. tritici TaxID=56615 RepID=A0A5B0SP37_PUCGR|nr:hypothetical protein PGTUg99_029265 [Puccinia graminis f. sp. tritici]